MMVPRETGVTFTRFEAIMTAIGAVIALLGYLSWLVLKIRAGMHFVEEFMTQHRTLMETAHRHGEGGEVKPVQWRRRRRPPRSLM